MDHPGPSQQPQINANSEEGQPMMNDHSNDKVGALGLTFTRLMEMAREMAMNLSMNQDVRVIQINIFEGRQSTIAATGHEAAAGPEAAVRGDEGFAPPVHVNGSETPQGDQAVLEQGAVHSSGESQSVRPMQKELGQNVSSATLAANHGATSAAERAGRRNSTRKRARMAEQSSGRCDIVVLDFVGDGAASNGNEGLAPPAQGNFVVTPERDALDGESQFVRPVENVVLPEDREELQMTTVEAVTTTIANPRGRQPARMRQQRPKVHHGVRKRDGGDERPGSGKFVVDFRPSSLPESDKRWAVVGEFDHESDAWNAFNLMAFVHEGEEATINADIKSIAEEAEEWKDLHRVDLLAHLRLRGRGFWDEFGTIPRYRSVRRVESKGKVRWNCNVTVKKKVVDLKRVVGQKLLSTFDTTEEAAREVDRRSYLNEKEYAWTNFALTACMTDPSQLDKTWLPLTDDPKKYLEGH